MAGTYQGGSGWLQPVDTVRTATHLLAGAPRQCRLRVLGKRNNRDPQSSCAKHDLAHRAVAYVKCHGIIAGSVPLEARPARAAMPLPQSAPVSTTTCQHPVGAKLLNAHPTCSMQPARGPAPRNTPMEHSPSPPPSRPTCSLSSTTSSLLPVARSRPSISPRTEATVRRSCQQGQDMARRGKLRGLHS